MFLKITIWIKKRRSPSFWNRYYSILSISIA